MEGADADPHHRTPKQRPVLAVPEEQHAVPEVSFEDVALKALI